MTSANAPDQFYTGLVAVAYGPLRGDPAPAAPYRRFVSTFGEPALEIGCGHGEPMLELVGDGLNVWGLDSSADMLDLCRRSAESQGLSVTLLHQRMEELDAAGQRFGSIYIAGPSFQLVVDPAAALETLRRIGSHLLPAGRALIPLFTPTITEDRHLGVWREHVAADGETLAFRVVAQSHRPHERRIDYSTQYRRGPADSPNEMVERTWSLCWYDDGDFEVLVDQAGLTIERLHDHGRAGRSYELSNGRPT